MRHRKGGMGQDFFPAKKGKKPFVNALLIYFQTPGDILFCKYRPLILLVFLAGRLKSQCSPQIGNNKRVGASGR